MRSSVRGSDSSQLLSNWRIFLASQSENDPRMEVRAAISIMRQKLQVKDARTSKRESVVRRQIDRSIKWRELLSAVIDLGQQSPREWLVFFFLNRYVGVTCARSWKIYENPFLDCEVWMEWPRRTVEHSFTRHLCKRQRKLSQLFTDVGQLPIVSRARWADYSQHQSQCTPLDWDLSRRIKIT